MTDRDDKAVELTSLIYPDSYLLQSLDLYNWGPFSRRHHVDIDAQGTAIIGATGSGKTTLVDGLMTLICERPRYNLASTGGHESDRDLVSYVRGKTGEGNNLDDSHIARPGKTLSAIAASFSDGKQQLQIAGIFWLDSSGSALSELKRLWIYNRSDQQDLDNLLELHHQGGSKAVKQYARSIPDLRVTNIKKSYLAQLRRFFEVGENAFTLLNRAAGLKQLNSIDEIFRELVLDDNSVFERAIEVVNGFDTLTTIHEELLIARNQHDALLPIQSESQKHDALRSQRKEQSRMLKLVPTWYAELRFHLLQIHAERLKQQIAALQEEIDGLERQSGLAQQQVETLQSAYMKAGGGAVEETRRALDRCREDREKVADSAKHYQQLMRRFDLNDRLDVQGFNANQPLLGQKQDDLQQQLSAHEAPWHAAISVVQNLKQQLEEAQAQWRQVAARPGSNIPPAFDTFRQQMAQQLGLHEEDLPYLAELVEVKTDQSAWRGAIERAIGGHRLRILVPQLRMEEALRWIDGRDNRLHVRLLEVKECKQAARFLKDGFVHKLNFKKHPHREAVKRLLAGIDRHCVDSTEALRGTEHGMTREGSMSGRRGYFEKQDNRPLNQNWMTGFDNRDRLAQLRQELQQGGEARKNAEAAQRDAEKVFKQAEQELFQLKALRQLSFSEIDLHGCEDEIAQYEQRLRTLQDPDSDTGKAQQRLQVAQNQLQGIHKALMEKQVAQGTDKNNFERVNRQKKIAFEQVGKGLDGEQREWLSQRLEAPDTADVDELISGEKQRTETVNDEIKRLDKKINTAEIGLVRLMARAKNVDTGALAETGTELQDIPDYLARLDLLTQEALPEKESRFLEYLRDSSDQSVTQLLSAVENEVSVIEDRIDELNGTMYQVDFQQGRFLRLDPQRVVHESIRTLTKAQRHLNSARLKDDVGESHYKALQQVVALLRDAAENRKKVGARALLDPRYRLQFKASVVDRAEQRVIDSFSSSQGGSGGEKEIIASYILTASLSYALCSQGARKPLFGTIVLDEAFSKSSQAVAGRIVSALRQFGLHPLFVTPNKEMQLLRTHTRSAVLIHRKGNRATTTSMRWEELRERAQQVKKANR